MIELHIPGRDVIKLKHLVLDVNGTIAVDGELLPDVAGPLLKLRDRLEIHMLTANTFGKQDAIDQRLGLQSVRLEAGTGGDRKADYVRELGAESVVAMGNGANDASMLQAAAIGIAVLGHEGLATAALTRADLVVGNPAHGLALLENPRRLIATLRL